MNEISLDFKKNQFYKNTISENEMCLVNKSYEIDAIMDVTSETYENKEKAKLILAQIHDKLATK